MTILMLILLIFNCCSLVALIESSKKLDKYKKRPKK